MSIEILKSETISQIAAGEVVERPAHLIKELVENALDAGADQIDVEFNQGGLYVSVTDNGSGISKLDLPLALMPHATSKIREFSDLFQLGSYGFRGEALASIAAISQLTMSSNDGESNSGFQISSQFGHISDVVSVSQSRGTRVLVTDVFSNVPARLKFLRSESSETSYIRSILRALALGRSDFDLRVRSQGKLTDFYKKTNLNLDRARDVLNLSDLYFAQSGELSKGGVASTMRCKIAFSSPTEVQKTSKNIWIFVQNRWVQDRALQTAVMDAYRSLLMHREFPSVVVWVDLDPSEVDVNVHPTKSQVKFRNPSAVFSLVQNTLREAITKAPWRKVETLEHMDAGVKKAVETYSQIKLTETVATGTNYFNEMDRRQSPVRTSAPIQARAPIEAQAATPAYVATPMPTSANYKPNPQDDQKMPVRVWSRFEVIGQLHLTYILAQSDDELLIVDQHAAHERVNFERIMNGFLNGQFERQAYLLPLSLDLERAEVEAMLSLSTEVERLGVELEQTGPDSVVVTARPSFVDDSGVVAALMTMAREKLELGGSFAFEKKVQDIAATMACHSSVRAGQALSMEQMRELLRTMDESPLSSFCPHGRPVDVHYSFAKLERDFGRRT